MELRIGYFPVLDAALALRQAYESVRFSPFCPVMQGIWERMGAADRRRLEELAPPTDGWLSVLGILLETGSAGLKGTEEASMQLAHDPAAALPFAVRGPFSGMGQDASVPEPGVVEVAAALLASTLRTGIAPEAGRRSRFLLEASEAIAKGVRETGLWPYLLGISDRLRRGRGDELVFAIKPTFRLRERDVERVVLTPSLVATRRLTYWRNGSTLVFFLGSTLPMTGDEPPDSLLLTALAVGDRTRLRMLRRLAEGACTNLEMAERLGIHPSTASRHFKVFKDAGFVELGERAEYELVPEAVDTALGEIFRFITGKEKP